MSYELSFLISLGITIFIETIVLITIVSFYHLQNISLQKLIFTGIFCSFATLPYLWFIFPYLIKESILYIILGELFVIIVEGIILSTILNFSYKKAFIISFICNVASIIVGKIIL